MRLSLAAKPCSFCFLGQDTVHIHTPQHAPSMSLSPGMDISYVSHFFLTWCWVFYSWNVEMYGKLSVGGGVGVITKEDCSNRSLS